MKSTDSDIACVTFPEVGVTVTLRDGKSYYVVLCEEAYALVQPEGCSGWAQVWLDDLDLADTDGIESVAVAASREAFVRVGERSIGRTQIHIKGTRLPNQGRQQTTPALDLERDADGVEWSSESCLQILLHRT